MKLEFGLDHGKPVLTGVTNRHDPCVYIASDLIEDWTTNTYEGLVELSEDKQYLRINGYHFRFWAHLEKDRVYIYYLSKEDEHE